MGSSRDLMGPIMLRKASTVNVGMVSLDLFYFLFNYKCLMIKLNYLFTNCENQTTNLQTYIIFMILLNEKLVRNYETI